MRLRSVLRAVARKPAREAFRVASAYDANIAAEPWGPAEPDRDAPLFRIRDAFVTFRFAELLTRPPIPRHIQSSSWGDGFFVRPSSGSSGDCPVPTALGNLRPRPGRSRWVQARAVPATAPCPPPLAFADRAVEVPAGSKPSQRRRRPRAPSPWASPTASWTFPQDPSMHSSDDGALSTAPRVPKPRESPRRWVRAPTGPAPGPCPEPCESLRYELPTHRGSEPRAIRRHPHPCLCRLAQTV